MGVFASHHAISFDGTADNNSRFPHLITEDLRKVRLPPARSVKLRFDGKKLCWWAGGMLVKCLPGVSGAAGFQSKDFQHVKDKGPVLGPPGNFVKPLENQNELQRCLAGGGESSRRQLD